MVEKKSKEDLEGAEVIWESTQNMKEAMGYNRLASSFVFLK